MSPASCAPDIGKAIRAARKQAGLTQTELADLSGYGLRFISELERGKARAPLGHVLHVVKCLGGTVKICWPSPTSKADLSSDK